MLQALPALCVCQERWKLYLPATSGSALNGQQLQPKVPRFRAPVPGNAVAYSFNRFIGNMPPLFLPFRALGYITEDAPFATQRLGRETFVTVSVGNTWQVELCGKTFA